MSLVKVFIERAQVDAIRTRINTWACRLIRLRPRC